MFSKLTRRQLMAGVALLPLQSALGQSASKLGGAPTGFVIRGRNARQAGQPFDFMDYCHSIGLSGVETSLRSIDAEAAKKFRERAENYGMRVVLNTPLPKSESDIASFDAAVQACKQCGAIALHAAMTQRRYEQFDTFDAFRNNFEQCKRSVSLAEPVLRKHRMKLAIENHKGWRAAEQAAWMKNVSSEWVGVCLDMGNNLALCEPPEETFRLLAPFAIISHIKDMGLQSYPKGFLLSEVPFGQGVINLKDAVEQLRRHDPNMLFLLEMITRDPLEIPVLTDQYWATFDDSYSPLPGRDLAKVLEMVQANPPKTPLPVMTGLAPAAQLRAEDDYNQQCIAYGRLHLGM